MQDRSRAKIGALCLLVALTTACAESNPALLGTHQGAALAVSSGALFQILAKADPNIKQRVVAGIGAMTIQEFYDYQERRATDAAVQIDGQVFVKSLTHHRAVRSAILALGGTFPHLTDLWAAFGFDPLHYSIESYRSALNPPPASLDLVSIAILRGTQFCRTYHNILGPDVVSAMVDQLTHDVGIYGSLAAIRPGPVYRGLLDNLAMSPIDRSRYRRQCFADYDAPDENLSAFPSMSSSGSTDRGFGSGYFERSGSDSSVADSAADSEGYRPTVRSLVRTAPYTYLRSDSAYEQ